jgi:hypothetical protein
MLPNGRQSDPTEEVPMTDLISDLAPDIAESKGYVAVRTVCDDDVRPCAGWISDDREGWIDLGGLTLAEAKRFFADTGGGEDGYFILAGSPAA